MEFVKDGTQYKLEFERIRAVKETTVRLLRDQAASSTEVHSHTVRCYSTDRYSQEEGRQRALAGLIAKLPGFRGAIFKAYFGRPRRKLMEDPKALRNHITQLQKRLATLEAAVQVQSVAAPLPAPDALRGVDF